MNPHAISRFLDAVIFFLGAEDDSLFEIPDRERDELFSLNFESLRKEQIIRNVSELVSPDNGLIADLLASFKAEVKTSFDSANDFRVKQRLADLIAAKVDIIRKGSNRLARTLQEKWRLPDDPRYDYSFSHQEVPIHLFRIQREMRLKGLVIDAKTEEEMQAARRNLEAYTSEKREGHSYFYFALLIADWTEHFLSLYLGLNCSQPDALFVYNKASPEDLVIITPSEQDSYKALSLPSGKQSVPSRKVVAETSISLQKPKRINTEAQEKSERVYKKYDGYIKANYTHSTAIQALVHDFRLEYNPANATNRKKTLQAIIRGRNNKE